MKTMITGIFLLMAVNFSLVQGNKDTSTQKGNSHKATVNQTGQLNVNTLKQQEE